MSPLDINLLTAAIPSLISGVGLYFVTKKLNKHQADRDKKEQDRIQSEIHMMDTVIATAECTRAIAKAVQRIPDAHCNGDMHTALAEMDDALKKQRKFLRDKSIESTEKE